MSVFSIAGKVDKRILVLPLLRVCSIDGATLLYTDDGCYRNLYQEYGNRGSISGVDILMANELTPETVIDSDAYKNIVIVSADPIDGKGVDIEINCRVNDCSFITNKKKRDKADSEIIFSSMPLKKEKNVLVLKPEYYRYLVETEEKKELFINKDKQLGVLLSNFVSKAFNMSAAQFIKLLTRDKYEISSKVKKGVR